MNHPSTWQVFKDEQQPTRSSLVAPEPIADADERADGGIDVGIRTHEDGHINDRLGYESRDSGRADMLDRHDVFSQSPTQEFRLVVNTCVQRESLWRRATSP